MLKSLFTAFLLFINLALIGRLVFLVSEAILNRPGHWEFRTYWAEGLISYSGSFFFSIAGLLNIYNWIYFTLAIKTIYESRKEYKQKIKKIVDIVFIPTVLCIVVPFFVGFIWSWLIPNGEKGKEDKTEDNTRVIRYFSIITCVIYVSLGVGFAGAGIFLIKEIKLRCEEAAPRMK